jgi:hypothetical protein
VPVPSFLYLADLLVGLTLVLQLDVVAALAAAVLLMIRRS